MVERGLPSAAVQRGAQSAAAAAGQARHAQAARPGERARGGDERGVWLLTWAHFSHDIYPSFLGVFIPAIQSHLHVSLTLASLMVPAQQLPSLLQPFIGELAERTSRRWFVILGPTTAAIALSLIGLAPNIWLALSLLLISGLASAVFHAPAISLVGEFGGERLGRAMAIFMAGGDLARTIGPVVITAVIALLGFHATPLVMVLGVLCGVSLWRWLDTRAADAASRARRGEQQLGTLLRQHWRPIVVLLTYTGINTAALSPLSYFLDQLLVSRGRSEWYGGIALSVLYASSVAGGLIGGVLSDRIGRRTALALSAGLSTPLILLYLALENGSWWVLGLVVLIGLTLMAARPVTLALANDILPEARGPMSGLVLAINFGGQSLAAIAFGALAGWLGETPAFWWFAWLGLLGLPLVLLLPRRPRLSSA